MAGRRDFGGANPLEKIIAERNDTRDRTKNTSQARLPEGWTRATFIMREDQVEMIRNIAKNIPGAQIKDVVEHAIELLDKETDDDLKKPVNTGLPWR